MAKTGRQTPRRAGTSTTGKTAASSSGRATGAGSPSASTEPLEVVDPRWLAKALALTVLLAIVCAYLALCLLVSIGAWQLMLHPSPKVDQTPALVGLTFDALRFDAAETGTPRLAGWWIPAADASAPTVLLAHDGSGSLAGTVGLLQPLHAAGVNIFAFDYRGYGTSDPKHPDETRMGEDTAAALDYLVNTRHLPASSVLPMGVGVGAALVASLAEAHPELGGVILDNPDPDLRQRVLDSRSSKLLPTALLIRDRFDLVGPLGRLKQAKLLIVGGPGDIVPARDERTLTLYRAAPEPRMLVALGAGAAAAGSPAAADPELTQAVSRYLDMYLPGRTPGSKPLLPVAVR